MRNLLIILLCYGVSLAAYGKEWTIGVLALRGDAQSLHRWQPLVDSLNQGLPDQSFRLLPLDLTAMKTAVQQGRVDFLLTNPAQYVQIDSHYPLRWLVSLRSSHEPDNASRNVVGSVILVRQDSPITQANELRGKQVGAVSADAFGGYLLGYKALRDAGLRPEQDFKLHFSGFPVDALMYLLRDGALDAAIVPTCLLEDMQSEGLLQATDFRALLAKPTTVPCLTSSDLYPNWSFAALTQVPDSLADRVTRTLLTPTGSEGPQWGAPSSTSQVEALLRSINQHPEQPQLWQAILSWALQNRLLLGIIAAILLLLGANHIWVAFLVRRRSQQLELAHLQLRERETALEQAQRLSILGEMASGFAHELNQPLSAIRHYAEGCDIRLKREQPDHPLLPVLQQIGAQAQRGADIIANLRLWVEKAPAAATRIPQAPRDVAEHVWQLIGASHHYPDSRLNIELSAEIQLMLPATLLDQIFCNLFTNSLQAGARRLFLNGNQTPEGIELSLQDDGGGLTASQLNQLFMPFKSGKPDGLGLGLVICQRLMGSQGGQMTLSNALAANGAAGSQVRLFFPLHSTVKGTS